MTLITRHPPSSSTCIHATVGERSYTEVKCLGDGSFGTVWLCDWHSPVKDGVLLSAMQCGAGTRREWVGKRLVALKRMKKVWQGGWSEAKNLGELAVGSLYLVRGCRKDGIHSSSYSVTPKHTLSSRRHPTRRRLYLGVDTRTLLCIRVYGG